MTLLDDAVMTNTRTGHGTVKDKSFQRGTVTDKDLGELYDSSDIAKLFVDKEPDDATREWLTATVDISHLEKLGLQSKVNECWKKARLCGLCFLYLSCNDSGSARDQLNINSRFRIVALTILNKNDLEADESSLITSIDSPDHGKFERYKIAGKQESIHHSRLIRFDGDLLSEEGYRKNKFSHGSILKRRVHPIDNYESSAQSLAHLLQEFRTLYYQIGEFENTLKDPEKKKKLEAKLKSVQESLGLYGILISSNQDTFKYLEAPTQGAMELFKGAKERLQVASPNLPHTLLFNEPPGAGLSGHGGSQEKAWYNHVSQAQKTYLKPLLDRVFEIFMKSSDAPVLKKDQTFGYKFSPLFHESKKDIAERENRDAQTDNIYLQHGVVTDDQVLERVRHRYPEVKAVNND